MYKKVIFMCFYLLFTISLYSQKSNAFKLNFHWDHTGDNIEAGFQKNINNHSLSAGLLFFLNLNYDNGHWTYKRQFYASDFTQYFGLNLAYSYSFNIKNSDITPYLYYDFHVFYNRIRYTNSLIPYGMSDNKELYLVDNKFLSEPLFTFQHSVGFGVRFPVYKNIDLFAQTGVGIIFIPLKDTPIAANHKVGKDPQINFTIGAIFNHKK